MIRFLSKLHLLGKIAFFEIFFVKFFDHMFRYALKIFQKVSSRDTDFFKQSKYRKRSVRKSYFTLLELMVVLFIISFGVVLTGVKIKDVYQEQRFLSETQQVLSHLAMAQDLMLIMDTDVKVHFSPEKRNHKIEIWFEIEKPLDEGWARLVERRLPLSAIGAIEFDGRTTKNLTLQFSFGKMSKGELVLIEGDNPREKERKEFIIDLVGYPSPIGKKSGSRKEESKTEKSELLYPAEVYEKLYKDPNEEKNQKS